MGATDGLLLPIPEETASADGPQGFLDLANAVEDYLLDRLIPAGSAVTRSPVHHWNAGISFPSGTAVKRGDHFFHTVYNVLCAYDGTNWRQAEIPVVAANDTTVGFYTGQYRDRTGVGLERWDGAAWGPPSPLKLTPIPWNANMTNYGTSPGFADFRQCTYGRDASGMVNLFGLAKLVANLAAGATVTVVDAGQIPAGYRPYGGTGGAPEVAFASVSGGSFGRFDVYADGHIALVNNTTVAFAPNSFLPLGTVRWPTTS